MTVPSRLAVHFLALAGQRFFHQRPVGEHMGAVGDPAQQGEASCARDVWVLRGQRQVADDPYRVETRLMIVVPGGKGHRIAVQIAEQLLPRQLRVIVVENQDPVPVVLVERVRVIGDAIDVLERMSFVKLW